MSRSDDVVDGVKQMILDGRLEAGERLPAEKELATTLGVSRGSLREGVRALGTLGILDSRHGDGTYVTSLDPELLLAPVRFVAELQDDTSALQSVRRLLETEAAGLAALNTCDEGIARARAALDETARALVAVPADPDRLVAADLDFHRQISRASMNPVLAALVEALSGADARTHLGRGPGKEGAADRSFVEHEAILAAVTARDPDRARLRMATHLLGLEDDMADAQPTDRASRALR